MMDTESERESRKVWTAFIRADRERAQAIKSRLGAGSAHTVRLPFPEHRLGDHRPAMDLVDQYAPDNGDTVSFFDPSADGVDLGHAVTRAERDDHLAVTTARRARQATSVKLAPAYGTGHFASDAKVSASERARRAAVSAMIDAM